MAPTNHHVMEGMVQVAQLVVSGAAIGCVYALVALGFVLIFKATEVINFAQGELMMLGAFLGYTLIAIVGLNFWLGALIAIIGTALFGGVLDRVVVRLNACYVDSSMFGGDHA